MAGGGGGGDGEPEFQIAPMIDVLLVLLIFFMSITSAQVLKVDKSIELPLAANALKKENQSAEVIVNVNWDPKKRRATYSVDDKPYSDLGELTVALGNAKRVGERRATEGPAHVFRCVIRGDRDASALSVSLAMNAAAEAGISDISFSTVNKE